MPKHDKHDHPKHHRDDLALVDQHERDHHGPRHDHSHPERHERHRFGRGRRMLDHGEMRFILLDLLAERPRHGYEAIKAIEEASGGAYSPSPGVIYPTLAMLEDLGHATTEGAGGARNENAPGTRRQYAITEAGRLFLTQNRDQADAIAQRLAAKPTETALPVRRAAENLRTALRLRLAAGTDPTQTETIATLLDETAKRIEAI